MQKGFADYFAALHADFFCLQETKLQPEQIAVDFPGYLQFWNSAEKKGYSGTAVFTKHPPLSVTYGVGISSNITRASLRGIFSAVNRLYGDN